MRLKSVRENYVQKSMMFLYPLLGIKRGVSVTPIKTYMSWKDMYSITDNKLILVYYLRDDPEFRAFEDKMLLGNKLFEDFKELETGKGIYIFNFDEYKSDYNKVINGKYSLLSDEYKSGIMKFYQNHRHVESYLYPEKYFDEYAILLAESRDRETIYELMKKVGELCSLPDLSKETLEVSEKVITFDGLNKI